MKLKIPEGFISEQSQAKWLVFRLDKSHNHLLGKLNKTLQSEEISLVIDKWRKVRGLTANSYLFVLLNQLAPKLNESLGNQYVKAIKDYGQCFKGIAMHKEALKIFEQDWNNKATTLQHSISMVDVINEFTSKGVEWVEIIAWRGSSQYDSKEFSILLNGVIEDCKEQGIETMTADEIQQLINTQKMIESEG